MFKKTCRCDKGPTTFLMHPLIDKYIHKRLHIPRLIWDLALYSTVG